MTKLTLLKLSLLLLSIKVVAQDFGTSASCNENANNTFNTPGRSEIIRSTVKMEIEGGCTGTLLNRNIGQNSLGFYIMTARHCTHGIDFNADHYLYFNFQSPDENNSSTAVSNRGAQNKQSTSLTDNGYEYYHKTKLRLVEEYFWGDFALVEILTPIPPHFNVYYAGWSPSMFYQGTLFGSPPPCNTAPNPYVGLHHPKGDIKKISGTNYILNATSSINTGCYTVTTIIDFLFGWIWGHQVSTQVICNYLDVPWYTIPVWCHGRTEPGSSGSGLFNTNNRLIGQLSGGLSGCNYSVLDFYGKFNSNYFKQTIKNQLNPANDLSVDVFGLSGRQISCYTNLTLPGATGVSGYYFPASHYQSDNKVVLRAEQYIQTSGMLKILSGADYEFKSASVTLNPGFETDPGATFVAAVESCDDGMRIGNPQAKYFSMLSNIDVPKKKDFDIGKYSKSDITSKIYEDNLYLLNVYPNPSNGNFFIELAFLNSSISSGKIVIVDMLGKAVYDKQVTLVKDQNKIKEDVSSIAPGIYSLNFTTDYGSKSVKLVVQ